MTMRDWISHNLVVVTLAVAGGTVELIIYLVRGAAG